MTKLLENFNNRKSKVAELCWGTVENERTTTIQDLQATSLPLTPSQLFSIWKVLGTHLSSCVVKQREGANYEWFKYRVPWAGQGRSQRWGPARRWGQVTGTSQPTKARSAGPRCWQMLFSSLSLSVRLEDLALGGVHDPRPVFWSPRGRQCRSGPRTSKLSLNRIINTSTVSGRPSPVNHLVLGTVPLPYFHCTVNQAPPPPGKACVCWLGMKMCVWTERKRKRGRESTSVSLSLSNPESQTLNKFLYLVPASSPTSQIPAKPQPGSKSKAYCHGNGTSSKTGSSSILATNPRLLYHPDSKHECFSFTRVGAIPSLRLETGSWGSLCPRVQKRFLFPSHSSCWTPVLVLCNLGERVRSCLVYKTTDIILYRYFTQIFLHSNAHIKYQRRTWFKWQWRAVMLN